MNRVALSVILLLGYSATPAQAQARGSRTPVGSSYAPTTYADYAAKSRSSYAPTTYAGYAGKSRSSFAPTTYEDYAAKSPWGLVKTTGDDGIDRYVRNSAAPSPNSPTPAYSDDDPPPGALLLNAPIPTFVEPAQGVVRMQFPAAAEVWLNGEKCRGLDREWVFTSPVLPSGTAYLFDVRARWTIDGKVFETERSTVVLSGNKSRTLVVGGRQTSD